VVDKAYIIRNDKGEPVRVVGSIRDITERKEAEEKLVRERYLLRTLIDHIPDYIYVKDSKFRHIINNKANVELMGAQNEEETLGKSVFDYFDSEIAEQYIKNDRLVMEKGEAIYNLEEAIFTHGNKKRWLLTTKVPLKDDNNKVFGLVGISRDITAQKEIAESLRISNERFNIVSKATNDAIWDWNLITDEMLWNKAVIHLFGYKDNEIGKTTEWWYNKIHPEDRERVLSKMHHHIDRGIEKWQDEYRFVKADGTYKFVLDRGFILLNDDQKPYRMIGAMMDITERRKLEAELAEQKINKQREITEATIQAQEKERSELGKELHDNINQILSTTKLYIDMALTETDIREELLQKTYKNISSAIEEIRMLSKSLVPPSLGDIGLKEAVSELIASLNISQRIKLTLKTVGIEMFTMPDNIKLMAYRIVQEQVNNIIKHSRATEAEIKLAVSRKMFNITVKDNGIGFDAKRRGKGIGLSNITSRAELHNGKVDVVSSPGKGCTLKISLPF
jgi:two-component system sensor histidine kinase UhpB